MKNLLDFSDPLRQFAMLGLTCLLTQLMALVVYSASSSDAGRMMWVISATALLMFAIFNAMLQLKSENSGRYLTRSLWAYLGMVALTVGLALGLSSGSQFSSQSMKAIYMVITLCYVIFLVIVFLMRRFIEYAKRQDQESIDN